MNFERGKDPRIIMGIGLEEAIKGIIIKHIRGDNLNPVKPPGLRANIINEVEEFTGWKNVNDISSYDYPNRYKFRGMDGKTGMVKIITVSISDEDFSY